MADYSLDRLVEDEDERPLLQVPFDVGLAVGTLVLSLLYAFVFSGMVYTSLIDLVVTPHLHSPRYAGQVHYHNPIEWLLIVGPMVVASIGVAGSCWYLARRWFAR